MPESDETGQELEQRQAQRLLARIGGQLDDPAKDAAIARHDADEAVFRPYTDAGNAMRLADMRDGQILYSRALSWLVWDGRVWKRDEAGRVAEMAKKIPDSIRGDDAKPAEELAEAIVKSFGNDKATAEAIAFGRKEACERVNAWATKTEAATKLSAIERLASTDPRLVLASVDELDAIDNALNVQNGVLDLDTGKIVEHHPNFKLTKMANASYDPDAKCPKWDETVKLFLPDPELRRWVQMAMGYSMLGTYSEWLFIPFGGGANGKSTILNAVRHVLGDYAGEAAPQLLEDKREQTPASDSARAGLRGMRFVTTIETRRGGHLAEVLMKQLTGEARLTAKYMTKDYFEFQNQTAVWLATNHKPSVQGSDLGVWRRMRLIPFTTTLDEDQRRDPGEVNRELEAEADGILGWLVEGLRMYREQGGLDPIPKAVREATDEYQEEMSALGEWLDECCELGSDKSVSVSALRESYTEHCKQASRYVLGPVNFNSELVGIGAVRGQQKLLGRNTKVWKGIGLRDSASKEQREGRSGF